MEEAEEEGRSRCPELVFYLPSSAIFHIFASSMVRSSESAGNEIRSKAIPFWKALPSQSISSFENRSPGFGPVNRSTHNHNRHEDTAGK